MADDKKQVKKVEGDNMFAKGKPVSNTLEFLGTLILANIYFLLCCLPIVTIGASLTSLNYCMIKYKEDGDVKITSMFFQTFKANIIDATLVFIIDAGFMSMAGLYGMYVLQNGSTTADVITLAVLIVALFFLLVHFTFYYVLLARYENDVMTQIKNSFLVGISHLGWSLVIIIVWVLVLGLFLLAPGMLLYFGWLLLMCGFSGLAYFTMPMYLTVFKKIDLKDRDA